MLSIEPLGLSADQWQFLREPQILECYVKSSEADRPLAVESTRRQFKTARDILDRLTGQNPQRGVLLADDVGLGKTTVAALVAWVVASAGGKRKVRILAPNDVMVRRWVDELQFHVEPLNECATNLDARKNRVRVGRERLFDGTIQVVKHSYASQGRALGRDLLIVDEAHRAKGEDTWFS
ncbi:MAG: DEAD/DEAH box helicase family protein [Bryobacterales bacterium]|nr:DEAD/DEAH box helicase family protein [Bryobacterales bacterium]